jgi:uncharacterized membrane protein
VVLGNLLHVENGSDVSTFATTVSVFNLIEGVVQLANKKNGVVATVPINLAGLAQITARVQVLEPPQLSAIGNPKNAALDPLGPNRIYVRTAQLRTLLSIDLPALDAIAALVNAAADLAGPLTNTLNALLNLDLVAVLNSLTCAIGVPCQTPDVIVLPGPIRLDVAVDVASADSYVTAYSCISNTNKTLTTNTRTSLVNLKIGRIDAASMFGSNTVPPTVTVQPLKLIDIGIKTCRRFLFVPITCDPRVPGVGGGIDVVADTSVAANTNMPHVYSAPPANSLPDINQPPFYYSFSTSSIVSNLLNTPVNLHVDMYGPSGSLVGGLGAILSSVTSLLVSAINGVLNPLLDSLINTLLISLGVDLNKVDVGANLSCHSGRASLVI